MFLYGDCSPSPLEIDYLGYLRGALALAVEIVLAEDQLIVASRRAQTLDARAAQLEKRLEELHQTVRRAVGGVAGSPDDDAVSRCANQIEGAVESVVTRAVAGVLAQRDASAADLAERRRDVHATCARALATFLRTHDLPEATRSIELAASRDGVTVQLLGTTPYGVAYTIDLDRRGSVLAGDDLRAGVFHKTRLGAIKLDKLQVVAARSEARTIEIELRSGRDASSADGVDLLVDHTSAGRPRLLRAGSGERIELTGEDASAAAAFATSVHAALEACRGQRGRLVSVTIDDMPLDEHDRPSTLVDRIFAAMAPTVRAIVEHSKVPGELSLRRELGGDRREEIFVTHAALAEMVAQVPSKRRRHFGALGLPGLPGVESGPPSADDVEIIVDSDSSISIQIES
jgi:hypothetical protein